MALHRMNSVLYGATNLPAQRSAQDGKAPARGDGQALALAPCGLVRERWRLIRRKASHLDSSANATRACPWDGVAPNEPRLLWRRQPPRSEVSARWPSASPPGRAGARPRASLVRGRVRVVRSNGHPAFSNPHPMPLIPATRPPHDPHPTTKATGTTRRRFRNPAHHGVLRHSD